MAIPPSIRSDFDDITGKLLVSHSFFFTEFLCCVYFVENISIVYILVLDVYINVVLSSFLRFFILQLNLVGAN